MLGAMRRSRPPASRTRTGVAGLSGLLSILLAACLGGPRAAAIDEAVETAPPVTVSGSTILVDGRPTFLIGSWGQCAADVERNLALGVNLFVTSLCDERALSDRVEGRAWMIQSIATEDVLPASIGFLQPDEPDVNGIPASRLEAPRGGGKLTILDVSMDFWEGSHRTDADYEALFRKGDVLSTNVYPIELNCNREPWVTLETPYDVQLELAARGKPSGQWLEVNHIDGTCGERLTPAMVRAEAWLAVEGGASWIGWFLPEGDHGGYETFLAKPAILEAVGEIDYKIQSFAPVLLAPRLSIRTAWGNGEPDGPGSNPIKVGGREFGGRYWLFATNSTTAEVEWTRALPQLAAKGVVRVDGGDELVAGKAGTISDTYKPLETKVYSWVPTAAPNAPLRTIPRMRPVVGAFRFW